MKKLTTIFILTVSIGFMGCKKTIDVNPEDHGKSFIKVYSTLAEGVDIVQSPDGGFYLLGTTQGALNKV